MTTPKCLALVGLCLVRNWVHTEETRSPETRASLVSASGCCCLSGYPLPCSAVPDSSCFPARSDNQSHEMIMAWCGLPAHSSWDHSPVTPLQTRAESLQGRVLVQQSGRVLKFTSQWVNVSTGGHKLLKQWWLAQGPSVSLLLSFSHPFASSACWWLNL